MESEVREKNDDGNKVQSQCARAAVHRLIGQQCPTFKRRHLHTMLRVNRVLIQSVDTGRYRVSIQVDTGRYRVSIQRVDTEGQYRGWIQRVDTGGYRVNTGGYRVNTGQYRWIRSEYRWIQVDTGGYEVNTEAMECQ